MSFADLLRVAPDTTPDLSAIAPDSTPGFEGDKAEAHDRLKELRGELADFQERLWAESEQSLLIVLQAVDAPVAKFASHWFSASIRARQGSNSSAAAAPWSTPAASASRAMATRTPRT